MQKIALSRLQTNRAQT